MDILWKEIILADVIHAGTDEYFPVEHKAIEHNEWIMIFFQYEYVLEDMSNSCFSLGVLFHNLLDVYFVLLVLLVLNEGLEVLVGELCPFSAHIN